MYRPDIVMNFQMNVRNPSSWFWMLLCISSSVSASLSLPHGWRRTAPVDDHTPLSLLLALSSDISVEELEEALYDVSDPLSPKYIDCFSMSFRLMMIILASMIMEHDFLFVFLCLLLSLCSMRVRITHCDGYAIFSL